MDRREFVGFGAVFAASIGVPVKLLTRDIFERTEHEREDAIFEEYMANVGCYLLCERTPDGHEPDERFMRDLEDQIEIPEVFADDFRRSIAAFIGTLMMRGNKPRWDLNPQLAKAIKLKVQNG